MRARKQQRGATLIISLIMLMVVTMLVVYSIRSGNTNLRIAGNMQFQAEATAATQQGVERVIDQIKTTDLISMIPAQTFPITMNGLTYNVQTAPMNKCLLSVPVLNSSLSKFVTDDVPCFESNIGDLPLDPDGKFPPTPSACNSQVWEIQSSVTDPMSGASLTQVQGVTIRVPATVTCS
jgi:hypothetical protein